MRENFLMIELRMYGPIVITAHWTPSLCENGREIWLKLPILTEDFEFYQFVRSISPIWNNKRMKSGILMIGLRICGSIVITVSFVAWFLWKDHAIWLKLSTFMETLNFINPSVQYHIIGPTNEWEPEFWWSNFKCIDRS
jgi:hypothetical protein